MPYRTASSLKSFRGRDHQKHKLAAVTIQGVPSLPFVNSVCTKYVLMTIFVNIAATSRQRAAIWWLDANRQARPTPEHIAPGDTPATELGNAEPPSILRAFATVIFPWP